MSSHFSQTLPPQSPHTRPLSSTCFPPSKPQPHTSRSIELKSLRGSLTKPVESYLKLIQQEMRSTKAEQAYDTPLKINLNNKKKLRMHRMRKEGVSGRPIEEQPIFVDRKRVDYRRMELKPKKMTARLKARSPGSFREEIGTNLKEKFNCITPSSKPIETLRKDTEQKNRYFQSQRITPKPRPIRSQSRPKRSITDPEAEQFDQSPLEVTNPQNQKMNRILDVLGDKNLNNILWNDPAIKKIIQQIGIDNEEQLNDYLENNSEYFENLFRTSPFANVSMHYLKPKNTIYCQDYSQNEGVSRISQAAPLNNMPTVVQQDYECLATLYRQKKNIKGKKTIQQSQFVPKETKLQKPSHSQTLRIGEPQITTSTNYRMNFPNRGDYDPNRIFKRLQQPNVVTGAHWMYRTSYQESFRKTERSRSQSEDLFSIDYIKQRQQSKPLYIRAHTQMTTEYDQSFSKKLPIYNRPLSFKYATELQKPNNKSLPLEAYSTTKKIDSRQIVQMNSEILKRKHKKIEPWKYRVLSKLKALMEYKKYLNRKKK